MTPIDGDWLPLIGDEQICGVRQCPTGSICGSLVKAFDSGEYITVENLHRDREIASLNWGITNFDNIGSAFLTIFQCITMEGWTLIMYNLEDAYISAVTSSYFVLCVVICSLFLLNLTIAVMLQKYDDLGKANHDDAGDNELEEVGREACLPDKIIQFIIENDNLVMSKSSSKNNDSE